MPKTQPAHVCTPVIDKGIAAATWMLFICLSRSARQAEAPAKRGKITIPAACPFLNWVCDKPPAAGKFYQIGGKMPSPTRRVYGTAFDLA